MIPARTGYLVDDMNRVAYLPCVDRFEVVGLRTVRPVDLAPGTSLVRRFDHHEQVVRLRRLHDEIQITVGSLPGSDPARRLHEGSSDMAGRDGQAEHRVP